MTEEFNNGAVVNPLGKYLDCDPETIHQALNLQQQFSIQGIKKLFGQVLVESRAVSPEKLREAVHLQRMDRLRICSLFADFTDQELERLSGIVHERKMESGKIFIRQDDTAESFFIIIRGEARIYRLGDYGEEIPLAVLGPGEFIGEMGYFSDKRRTASVISNVPCLLMEIKYMDLQKAFELVPKLAVNLLNVVTSRLRSSNLRFQESFERRRVVEHSLENLRSLLDLSEILTLRTGIEGLIQRVVLLASKVMNADRASLFMIDDARGELWSKVAQGNTFGEIRFPMGVGIAGWVARHEEILNIEDAYEDSRFNRDVDRRTGYRTRSILCGPVVNLQGETIGVVQVINKHGGPFNQEDIALFQAFLYQTAISVENFKLYNRIMSNHGKMAIFLDVATRLSRTLDLDTLIDTIVGKISEILNAERSSLFLLDKSAGELWSKVAQGAETYEIRFSFDKGLAGHCVKTGTVLNIPDAYEDNRFDRAHDRATGFRTRSVLCAPVINRSGEIIGVAQTINKKAGYFDEEDEDLLRALSTQVAVALENARLYEQTLNMKNYLSSVQESINSSILTLDNDHKVVTANQAALRFFDLRPDQVLQKDIRSLFGEANAFLIQKIDQVYLHNVPVAEVDLEVVLPGDRTHSVNLQFFSLLGHKGERQGQVLVLEDISREKRIKSTLTRYLSKDIVDKVLDDPRKQVLGGVRSKASILFSDIRGFTGLTETLTAEEAVRFLNDYFSVMVDVIFQHNGILDKFIGDAIMAVYGVPYPRDDDAVRAVRTGLRMVEVLSTFNQRLTSLGRKPIAIGIGICSDDVISGNIGSDKRMDYTVIGDGVNISARLENLNKVYGTRILIGETTWNEVKGLFTVREIDHVVVKGKTKALRIYEVLGDAGTEPTEAQSHFAAGRAYYTGREWEEAARRFEQGADEDPACAVFLSRCNYLQEHPVPDGWNGVWIFDQK